VSKTKQDSQFGPFTKGKVTWNKDDQDYMKSYMTEYRSVVDCEGLAPGAAGVGIPSRKNTKKSPRLVVVEKYGLLDLPPKAGEGRNRVADMESNPMHEQASSLPSSAVCPREMSAISKIPATAERASRPEAGAVSIVYLSEEDCDLDFVHEGGGQYSTLTAGGFSKMWSGARTGTGLCGEEGKFMFEVRILDEHPVSGGGSQNLCRVGWSCRDSPTYGLGELGDGWGFGGTGKKSYRNNFVDFGEAFGLGDVISCGVDLHTKTVWYAKNGKSLGQAFTIDSGTAARGLFPHVLLKNVRIEVSFASRLLHNFHENEHAMDDFLPMESAVSFGVTWPQTMPPQQSEVIMLVGLPKVGKSAWVKKHISAHPEKLFYVLSINEIMMR